MIRFLLITLLLVTAPAYGLVVEFKTTAKVAGTSVTLGDIADFNDDSDLSRALATQTVAQAPSPGREIELNAQPIITYFSKNSAINESVEWRGAATIRVTRSAVQVSSAEILDIITGYLRQKKSALPLAEIRFIPSAQPLPFTMPDGELRWEVVPSDPNIIGSSRFTIIFKVDGRVRKNMSIRGKVEAIAPVVVAADNLRKGTVLTPSNLAMSTQDISSLQAPCLDPRDVIGKKLTVSVKTGHVLSEHQVAFPPLVKKGDLVRIILRRGSLLLTASGIARSDGLQDQTIRVQNTGSHKIVYCRVAAPGVVEVAL